MRAIGSPLQRLHSISICCRATCRCLLASVTLPLHHTLHRLVHPCADTTTEAAINASTTCADVRERMLADVPCLLWYLSWITSSRSADAEVMALAVRDMLAIDLHSPVRVEKKDVLLVTQRKMRTVVWHRLRHSCSTCAAVRDIAGIDMDTLWNSVPSYSSGHAGRGTRPTCSAWRRQA